MIRIGIFCVSALAVGAFLVRALMGMPQFGGYRGPYGDVIIGSVIQSDNSPQAVTAVMFDFRGFDTLGEEFILFTAVAGALLLMRREREEHEDKPRDQTNGHPTPPMNDALHIAGMILFPVALILGISMILHGHLTPGGGFQGGVLVASAFYFIYLSGEYGDLESFAPDHVLDFLEAFGAGAFVLFASAPLLQYKAFMTNILSRGSYGELLSAGTLPWFNAAGGIEVAAAFLLLIISFLKQAIVIRRGGRK